jgi:glycosyltransferase involved in cell wall biosynthesis
VVKVLTPELPFAVRDKLWKRLSPPHRAGMVGTQNSASPKPSFKSRIRGAVQRMLFPDVQSVWAPFAIRAASQLVAYDGIDTVILNAPPFSLLKIGIALKRKFPHLRLISDLRDDWVGYYAAQFDSPSAQKLEMAKALERQAVELSSTVSIASPVWLEHLRARYPDQPADKFICTTNAYEPESFTGFPIAPRRSEELLVTYFGTVYMSPIYSPARYLDAVASLPEEQCGRIHTRFIGRVVSEAEWLFSNRNTRIERLGFMPKLSGLEKLRETDLLLLIVSGTDSHAGKLFDYLATGKPILALTPPHGAIADVVRETRTGWAIDPNDRQGIQRVLQQCLDAVRNGTPLTQPNWEAIQRYSAPEVVAKFAIATGLTTA